MSNFNLTDDEQRLLERSRNTKVVRKGRIMGVVSGLVFTAGLAHMMWSSSSRQTILFAFVMVMLLSIIRGAFLKTTIIFYQELIQKLTKRIEELEPKEDGSQPEN